MMSSAPPSCLLLAGYISFFEAGFALPCFARSPTSKTWFTAVCSVSGDHWGRIIAFEEAPARGILPLKASLRRSISVGDPWVDVFRYGHDLFVGAVAEIYASLKHVINDMRIEQPSALADLELAIQKDDVSELLKSTHRSLKERLNAQIADEWMTQTVVRPQLVLSVRRLCATATIPPKLAQSIASIDVLKTTGGHYEANLLPSLIAYLKASGRWGRLTSELSSITRRLGIRVYVHDGPRNIGTREVGGPKPSSGHFRPNRLTLGGYELPILIMYEDASNPVSLSLMTSIRKNFSLTVPEEWDELWREARRQSELLVGEGLINNNPVLAVSNVDGVPDAQLRKGELAIQFVEVGYVSKRTATTLYKQMLSRDEKQWLLSRAAAWDLESVLGQGLNTQLAVITSDSQIMFVQRGVHVPNAGRLTCGVSKTMEARDAHYVRGKERPDVYMTGARSLNAELGVKISEEALQLHDVIRFSSLILDEEYYELILTGVADFRHVQEPPLRKATSAAGLTESVEGVKSRGSWKNDRLFFVEADVVPALQFLSRNDVTNYGTACLMGALQYLGAAKADIDEAYSRVSH